MDCIEEEFPRLCLCGTPSCVEGIEVGPDGRPGRTAGMCNTTHLQDSEVLIELRKKLSKQEDA